MKMDEIKELMALLEQSSIGKMVIREGDFELRLEKESVCAPSIRNVPFMEIPQPQGTAPCKIEGSAAKAIDDSSSLFATSPMVGTYYASSGPGQSPFVKVGDTVQEGSVVCIVEAMKVMNEVKAGVSGTIAEILIHNGQPVEFGTRLFRIVNGTAKS